MVSLAGDGPLDEPDFDAWASAMTAQRIGVYLSVVDGAARVSSAQRKRAARIFDAQGVRAAVVTDSSVTRGVVTAVRWLGGTSIVAFPRKELVAAVRHLGFTAYRADAVITAVARLERAVPALASGTGHL